MLRVHDQDPLKIRNLKQSEESGRIFLSYECDATVAYGMGERFDGVDRMGKTTECAIIEKFTHQGENSYFPLPFFFCNDGHGVFVETDAAVTFTLSNGRVELSLFEGDCDVRFLYGAPREIISQFIARTGETVLPPKWAFGPWISANRWKNQRNVEEQLAILEETGYPATVLVIEAWSDEATFYIWNGAQYTVRHGGESFCESDFTFCDPWPNPKKMIQELHRQGVRLVLWQIPALKKLDAGQVCRQHDADDAYAVQNDLVVKNKKGEAYQIPKQWFVGSHVPDFSNSELRKWWTDKRKYLLEMGVDGFKTDGGEFIHDLDVRFHNGKSGTEMRNRYVADYEKTYAEAVGPGRTLFSRAGYLGAQACPIHWAGDQSSTFSELRAVLGAGLSLGLCGVPFWSFDIGGFAGPLPSAELYLRSTELSVFAPVMQWHSEPLGGQFGGNETDAVNDRSPWNMAKATGDASVECVARAYARLRMNLLPELYRQAKIAARNSAPMMRHLVLDFPSDERAQRCHDEFMMGDLLIAPITEEGLVSRTVYLPAGRWYSLLTRETLEGNRFVKAQAGRNQIPVYLHTPGAVALNLPDSLMLGGDVGNDADKMQNLVIALAGEPDYDYADEAGGLAGIRCGKLESGSARLIDISVVPFAVEFQ